MRAIFFTIIFFLFAGSSGAIELTYWTSSNPEEIELGRLLVKQWNLSNPDVQVKMQPIPATQSSEEVLLAAIVSKTTPDVCSNILPAIMGRFTKSKAVLALNAFPDYEKAVIGRTGTKLADLFRSRDGKLYQVPWKCNPVMLAYNTAIFRALGLKPPKTYSDFSKVAETIAADKNNPGRWAMAVSIKTTWWQRLFDFYPFYVAATGGRTLLCNDSAAFNSPGGVAAMTFFRDGFRKRYFPMLGFSGNIFLEGKTAMDVAGPWAIKYYRRLKPGFEFDFAPIPVPDSYKGPVYTYGDPKNIVIFATTKYPKQSWEFVKFLISKEADLKLLELTNQVPMRSGIVSDPFYGGFFDKNPLLRKAARQAQYVVPMDESQHLVQILDIISGQFEAAAVYAVITPEKALAIAAKKTQALYDYW
ncbi:MAG: extracellular solute-binding protein [Elusimicrobiota bacterium]